MNPDAIKDGGAAYPVAMSEQTHSNQNCAPFQAGMSLRDYFAAKMMQARMTAFCALETHHGWTNKAIAEDAYEMADAMIAAREA